MFLGCHTPIRSLRLTASHLKGYLPTPSSFSSRQKQIRIGPSPASKSGYILYSLHTQSARNNTREEGSSEASDTPALLAFQYAHPHWSSVLEMIYPPHAAAGNIRTSSPVHDQF